MVRMFASAAVTGICLAGVTVSADAKPRPAPLLTAVVEDDHFDLADLDADLRRADEAAALPPAPLAPRGADMSTRAWRPPAVALQVANNGPVLHAGALGTRRKGMPKLAHIAVDWSF